MTEAIICVSGKLNLHNILIRLSRPHTHDIKTDLDQTHSNRVKTSLNRAKHLKLCFTISIKCRDEYMCNNKISKFTSW